MLKSIQVNNFKSLDFSESIDISPMSIFCGANSSGKSSFLQAILLLAQTSDTRFNGSSMLLNGKLVKLGGFNDIVSFGKENELIQLKADIEGNENSDINRVIVSLDFGFGHEISEVQREQISPPIKNITFEIFSEKQSIPIIIDLSSTNKDGIFKVNNINRKDILIRGKDPLDFDIKEIHLDGIKPEKCIIEYNSKKLEVSRSVDFLTDIKSHKFYYRAQKEIFEKSIDKKIIESIKNIVLREQNNIRKKIKKNIEEESPHSLPNNISKELVFQMILRSQITIDADELNQLIENDTSISAWVEYVNSLGKEQKRNLFSLITRNREEIISKTIGLNFKESDFETDIYLPPLFLSLSRFINKNLSLGIKYIGPLRSKPKSVYPLTDINNTKDIGVKGEHSAAILHINRNESICYPRIICGEDLQIENKNSTFSIALHNWLNYLDVVKSVTTKDQGKFGYELKVKTNTSESPQDLNHVGVGVSQVIPIVMQCLLSNKNDILIFEQPELHLHPKIQAKLCDLFIAMSLNGRQIIIETHSEYIINRLRYRIAQGYYENISNNISIKFVTHSDKKTIFEDIEISKYGAIRNWPVDFFDQSQIDVEKILSSVSRRKKLERANKLCK
ncbi:TPA: DUF3696 domain-containing protein [Vibrio parahaemolyticus]|uniref:DUF3696 domain-containing protein n=2 Tax=Vibrio parahaemolyticus TaxID=670 RepID=UPI00111CB7A9|nr:DUF3696 domain-containing protein [Vibrio parahaemolyticus]EHH2507864.1 DUF3696 domain-containing protein [Vibrio parahaemolyticus]EIZ1330717.1 DUF3696 domain-containing protein [Vibrio parahaemolyticus]EJB1764014.1 DUF3696 domain-containing protein [Vibrio parahaemolyticus]EJB5626039.1 DUF3696 domain-containing protein [Vibrio parahaemolyticus]ELB2184142.1 DUF3696 domain-containing protein [Vibrio parahaemolyticus]